MIYVVDNFYSDFELQIVWKELEYYSSLPNEYKDRAETTVVATSQGKVLGKSYRVYLSELYTEKGLKYSHITNLSYKLKDHTKEIENVLPNGRQFKDMNMVYDLISYYGPDDYYDTHYDLYQFTCLIWLYKEPKKFTGGDLFFPELNKNIQLKNNRMIFFPGYLLHKVDKINMSKQDFENGYGRYTVTHFVTHGGKQNEVN